MSDRKYEVGYKKPPKSGQFKAGRSGNPKGRPKGRKSMNTIIEEVFRKKITLRDGENIRKVSQIEALVRRVINDGLKGNARATDQALKMLQMMSNLQEQNVQTNDGTAPDLAADLETIEQLLTLHDVAVERAVDGGETNAS